MFATFENGKLRAHLDEYSDVNIEFHQAIIRLSHNDVLIDLAENLFMHMRMIRRKTIGEKDRVDRSIRDHMNIIEALEARATERAEELVRDHALGLADHVATICRLSGLTSRTKTLRDAQDSRRHGAGICGQCRSGI